MTPASAPSRVAALEPGLRGDTLRAFLTDEPKRLLIDGEWVASSANETLPTVDPATGEHLADVARGRAVDADAAVEAAERAFTGAAWRGTSPMERSRLLWRLADLMERDADQLAQLECLDQGKNWRTARFGEIPAAINQFRYYAGWPTKITGETIPTSLSRTPPGKEVFAYTRREPIGVVAAIVPWNSPLLMASMKLAPALAAGCTIVLKPAENTPLTALRLGELIIEAGFPPGVVNIVTGFGGEAGQALAESTRVAKVAFTGSTAVGKKLVATAAGDLKRLTLELGGKSPSIVMADADLPVAIENIARGIFDNGGQVCVASARVYAHQSVVQQLSDGLVAFADALRLGHGLDPDSDLGPLVSLEQAQRVERFVEEGRAQGATVLAGGVRDGAAGTFYHPTVVTDVTATMRLMREEIFGPVAIVTPFDDLDEVVGWANDSEYGLAASVFTEGLSSAHRVAARLQAGTVWVNCHSYLGPELPKGGHKQSGWGYENGAQGLENYLETKTVVAVI